MMWVSHGTPDVGTITITTDSGRFNMTLDQWECVYAGEADAPVPLLRYIVKTLNKDLDSLEVSIAYLNDVVDKCRELREKDRQEIKKLKAKLAKGKP